MAFRIPLRSVMSTSLPRYNEEGWIRQASQLGYSPLYGEQWRQALIDLTLEPGSAVKSLPTSCCMQGALLTDCSNECTERQPGVSVGI